MAATYERPLRLAKMGAPESPAQLLDSGAVPSNLAKRAPIHDGVLDGFVEAVGCRHHDARGDVHARAVAVSAGIGEANYGYGVVGTSLRVRPHDRRIDRARRCLRLPSLSSGAATSQRG